MYAKLANGFGLLAIAAVAVRKPQLSEMLLKAAIRTTGLVHGEQDASLRTPAPALIGLFPVTRLYGSFLNNVGLRRLSQRMELSNASITVRMMIASDP